ncbi:MgtC/SapB family protein [Azotobacter chroococcum]|uniref:Protein MgtC n=1 Tax=Azotobacter chroococcum TaxID=353 RepID=A0AA44C7P3_9GAMM|nr:MgtC/SapB family protein [Azotobacter chroococcum]NHN78981.1 MgtC/SapB family protein [Azotobacter chroococcum]TBW12188.1 MgtC/SapB family protein [Azotobacter chroococcum subsp. isscasi]
MSAWDVFVATLAQEFSDLSELEQTIRVGLRLLLAAVLGGLLGFEREHHGHAAGVRTHMLVALGAALFVLIPEQDGARDDALSRVIQGIVAGVGFLCAGTILKSRDKAEVKGLTTSAGLWLATAIGVAVGLGHQATAVLATLLGLFILNVVSWFLNRLEKDRNGS